MQVVKPGDSVTVDAVFVNSTTGVRYDPDVVTATVLNPNAVMVVTSAGVSKIDTGVYRYSQGIPLGSPMGYWTVRFTAVKDGEAVEESVVFEVNNFTAGEAADLLTLLRLRIGERIPVGKTAADTMFTDEELLTVYNSEGGLDAATLELWRFKSAEYANMIDRDESGSKVLLSQLHKNALAQIDRWEGVVRERLGQSAAAARVVGKPLAYLRDNDRRCRVMWTPMGNRA